MSLPVNPTVATAYLRFSRLAGIAVIALAVLALVGWAFDIAVLTSGLPGLLTMKPQTAICFILSGASLILSQPGERFASAGYRALNYVFTGIVLATAVAVIMADIFHLKLLIDTWFFKEKVLKEKWFHPGRMAEITAFNFVLINSALLSMNLAPQRHFTRQVLTLAALVVGVMVLIDYLFWAVDLYYVFHMERMALNTCICFILLSVGILFSRPSVGAMLIITSDTFGGKLIRNIYPKIIAVLLILTELSYVGQQLGYFDVQLGIGISTIAGIIIISYTLWTASRDLARQDMMQRETETELKQANQTLTQQADQLLASNNELERYVQITSHDLQEPLKTISTYASLINTKYKGKLSDDMTLYLGIVGGAAQHMRALVTDFLEYSRVRTAQTLIQVDCNTLVKELLSDLETTIQETGATIETTTLPIIYCYPGIKHVFRHLIDNALKYRKPAVPPVISINCQSQHDQWLFAISDNGIGIEKKYHERIFILFQKLHPRQKYRGTGAGLALCRKIVALHKGTIWVESQLGNGATFYFTISKSLHTDSRVLS